MKIGVTALLISWEDYRSSLLMKLSPRERARKTVDGCNKMCENVFLFDHSNYCMHGPTELGRNKWTRILCCFVTFLGINDFDRSLVDKDHQIKCGSDKLLCSQRIQMLKVTRDTQFSSSIKRQVNTASWTLRGNCALAPSYIQGSSS